MTTINSDTIDSLLQKAYWVVDILPKQVPSGSKGQYFKVEQFFLSHLQMESLYQKFAIIIIKLNCYDDISVCPADNEWIKNPNPSAIIQWLKDCPIEKKDIFVILESSETMITINSENKHGRDAVHNYSISPVLAVIFGFLIRSCRFELHLFQYEFPLFQLILKKLLYRHLGQIKRHLYRPY